MDKKTPLYSRHEAAGGRIVPFSGYLLPVQYPTGVIAEHMAVREKAGLFDVSHMGEVMLEGRDALDNLNYLLTNSFDSLEDGRVRYSPMCNEQGDVIDDLIVYRYNKDKYLIVVNAANREKDVAWMQNYIFGDVELTDISDSISELALQGPSAKAVLEKLCDPAQIPEKYYSFVDNVDVGGVSCLISRTGYTGERGYELYTDNESVGKLWDALLGAGAELGLVPCGLGARDTLRLEASMPLYGHEMDDTIDPLEAGLGFAVKMDKPDFIGKQALLAKGEPKRKRIGLKVTGRGIVREQCPLFAGNSQIGTTTSGTHCPFLGYAAAMALVDANSCDVGHVVEADVRGRRIECEVVPLPFYKISQK